MPRNNLLKKAFRNNFIRKSVADLKALTADKPDAKQQDASPSILRPRHGAAASVTPTSRTHTPDLPELEQPVAEKENSTIDPFVEEFSIAKKPNNIFSFESIKDECFPTPEPRNHEEPLDDVDPMSMTSSQVRQLMDKEHEELKASVRALLAKEQTSADSPRASEPDVSPVLDQLMSDCSALHASLETMILAHIDTIERASTVLQAIEKLSPHVDVYKQDLAVKKQMCYDMALKFLPVKNRLDNTKLGKGYA